MNRFWLNAAFYQASLADGNSGKNPAVGCVLVKNDQIIGVGHTSKGGRPHAEENALKMAGKDAKGANMYLTLEPCCLDDNLNSCTRQIIRAGVKKVFIGMIDYNKLTKRKSFQYLLNHGVQVELIFLDFENFLLNYSQYCVHVLNRPQITIKLASSADSKITYANGESKWITSKLSRSHVHQIRSNHDGILVGSKTSKIDDPSLTVRVPGYKKNIHRLVLDTNLNININSNLTKNLSKNPLVIFTSENTHSKKAEKLVSKGVEVYKVKQLKNGLLCLLDILEILNKLQIRKILVEGGAKTASTFLNSGFCDFIYIYKSSSFIGSEGKHAFEKLYDQKNFFLYNQITLKDNKLELWINKELKNIYKKVI